MAALGGASVAIVSGLDSFADDFFTMGRLRWTSGANAGSAMEIKRHRNADGAVMLTLAAGTPAITLIGVIGAALAAALRRGGLLMPVLILPLTVPVLIFGVAATNAGVTGPAPFGPPFLILCALSLISLVAAPLAAAAALRHSVE